jgi:hypothetical protein
MKVAQQIWTEANEWEVIQEADISSTAQLVLVFGNKKTLAPEYGHLLEKIKTDYPNAQLVLSSTSGEIVDDEVHDDSLTATAIEFEKTNIRIEEIVIKEGGNSESVGRHLARALQGDKLKHVFVVSDGLNVNGTDLIAGMNKNLGSGVSITGGLAGDGPNFEETYVGVNIATPKKVVGIGFYGDNLQIGYGSVGGWDAFGAERTVTKSEANVLYELDGKPALELYKTYLGKKADELPASALLFPLHLKTNNEASTGDVVRTILAVDEQNQSMTFAGDIPQGGTVQLMKANFDRLVTGASVAVENSLEAVKNPQLAILVSCVGRKLVLGQRIDDETEAIRDILGDNPVITGFYSYGELAPGQVGKTCQLHNQTMTVTLFSEG